ncbi:Oxidation resistance protein 1 [Fulvia fulva]|uniref:Oxidation resistance protein 1 n=1 Tax=Passalora fulva TaxID=5499 RepID=A0A9Q8PIY3_PASFU|nr:Oxidation resistance protein 1 [Fulvia fulva]KAK4611487.1 Oxidation resistance protein 1 [Fulvia fulva]KAK4612898.1 Oxidation resistance protein 1 [Fulvia fulva]UJO23323.1 Oxidation resistance protein 1 [Fulvia fulva]WPV21278.1 Oxidation resistance protein 1 [Fulvia fulva]WPV36435.1 Oxidation resistance protein 1 [Fulvia fulva]
MSSDTGPRSSSDAPRPPLQPPQPSSHNTFMSTLSYFTEPVSYTVKGLVRRLSEDEAPTALARALSANYNGSMTDPSTGVYHPTQAPMRRKSPFQPPPLTPLTLNGYKKSTTGKARLLRKAVAEEIRLLIPPRLQLMDHWSLIYSLEQNGSTLSTLYSLCDQFRGKRGGFVVVVRDSNGGTFGAYLSEAPKPQPHYFGNGECFLWRAFVLPAIPELLDLPPPPSADTTHAQRMTTIGLARSANGSNASLASLNVPNTNGTNGPKETSTPERIRFKAFPYTGENDFQVYCQQDYLSVGGGDGHYGLWLDQNLSNGVSDTCPTFGNEQLSEEGSKFEVMGVEIWYVGN